MNGFQKPTREQVLAAEGKTVPDIIAPNLEVLFCGINPGLYSGAVGHHFARPGNRFWPTIYAAGFTDRLLSPYEERDLLSVGCGITNIVRRATASAAQLRSEELVAGASKLVAKLKRHKPKCLAVLGISAYREAFRRPDSRIGRQDELIGESIIWVLPNPSGLNAHYSPSALAKIFGEFRERLGAG